MLPVLFKIGTFEVHSYGVVMVVAFLASIALAQVRASRYGFSKGQVGDMAFWALLAGVLGARIVFIVQELPYYLKHTSEIWSIQFRGLTSFGGLLFGMAAVIAWAKIRRIPIRSVLDLVSAPFVLGHAIGRIGCLLNGCCYGGAAPHGLPWAIHVDGVPGLYHPAQAYDTLMNLAVLGILLWRERKGGLQLGQLAGLALVLHGLTRVIYEFWRAGTDDQVRAGLATSTYWVRGSLPFTQAQAMAALLMLGGAAGYVFFGRKPIPQTNPTPA